VPQGRRVRRVIRRVEPWAVLKFSALFYLSILLVVLVAAVALWSVATSTGVRSDVEGFMGELVAAEGCGAERQEVPTTREPGPTECTYELKGDRILRASVFGGLILVAVGTGANVLFAVLYNLISDVVGGIEITVLEEERASRPVV
jgi:hypothetical protein